MKMRKNMTHKKQKKVTHSKSKTSGRPRQKYTRKYVKKTHRRTRRHGGMWRRLCRGLSCSNPAVADRDVVADPRQEPVQRMDEMVPTYPSNEPLDLSDVSLAMGDDEEMITQNEMLAKSLKTTFSTEKNPWKRINKYIEFADEMDKIDPPERENIRRQYLTFLSEMLPENKKAYKEIPIFTTVIQLVGQYKLYLRSPSLSSGRIIWPPNTANTVNKVMITLVEKYFDNKTLRQEFGDEAVDELNEIMMGPSPTSP